jgi:hypothetical protein
VRGWRARARPAEWWHASAGVVAPARQLLDDHWLRADFAAADLDHGRHVGGAGGPTQHVEDVPCEVALERAQSFAAGLAFLLLARAKGLRARVDAALDDGDLVQRGVQAAVAVSVEAVPSLLARGGVKWGDTGKASELGVVAEALDPGLLRQ